jgi:hypothetical protein
MIAGVLLEQGETLPNPTQDQIEFTVSLDAPLKGSAGKESDAPISVICSWKNVSSSPVEILLKDHDSSLGTLEYPYGIMARITNQDGAVLTATSAISDGYWGSSAGTMLRLSSIMPGDVVTIRPGETVVRKFVLDSVLAFLTSVQAREEAKRKHGDAAYIGQFGGDPEHPTEATDSSVKPFSFGPGTYAIKFRLFGLVSRNALNIHVN